METIKKILFPTDFSKCANHAFKSALKMANKYQAILEVLHVSILPISDPYSLSYYYPDSSELMLGSVTEKVVRLSKVPVFIIK